MMGLTSQIEKFLLDMLDLDKRGFIEIGRNDLAERFSCAPSQINYVLSTRFSPYKGYYVESRRGGRGYIKIYKIDMTEDELVNGVLTNTIKDDITLDKATQVLETLISEDVLSKREALFIYHAIDDNGLRLVDVSKRNEVRAQMFKNVLLALLRD
ncbi:MAG: CtsR family transcriptional regulator [Tissierellia bacterium]|nr:CtsR family transcriptional regulator [Tissierellia bacterium]